MTAQVMTYNSRLRDWHYCNYSRERSRPLAKFLALERALQVRADMGL